MQKEQGRRKKLIAWILLTGLLTGTIDILVVLIINFKTPPSAIFRFIASGFFGKRAFSAGIEMSYYGLAFHFFIALCWTTVFFLSYPILFKILRIKFIQIVFTGLIIWNVMNLVVVPLTYIPSRSFHVFGVIKEMVILAVAYGLPVTLIAGKYYKTSPVLSGNDNK